MSGYGEDISIHSPHTSGDGRGGALDLAGMDFNPLPSYERRLSEKSVDEYRSDFNPLPSYEGRRAVYYFLSCHQAFQSAPLIRGETVLVIYAVLHV